VQSPKRSRNRRLGALVVLLFVAGCSGTPNPSEGSPTASAPGSLPAATVIPTAAPGETPGPRPPLSLDQPQAVDARRLRVAIDHQLPDSGRGQLVVTVTNLAQTRINEIVLRWPTELGSSLFLSPFLPTPGRVCNACPPLRQEWSKWVEGPGQLGEPAGTTSLGWGPLDPGATLVIPIEANRLATGPFAFDFQLVTGEALLRLEDGSRAWFRIGIT
jgi:hypothetical protein